MKIKITQLLVFVAVLTIMTFPASATTMYSLDDGGGENSVGLTAGGDMIFLNQFTVSGTDNLIESISVAWGAVRDGLSATVVLWEDPNDDGSPTDAVLLTTAGVLVANSDTDTFNLYDIADTLVSGSFFAGVLITHLSGEWPARLDETASLGRSWVAGDDAGAGDIANLLNNSVVGLALIDSYGLPGNWMVRATGSSIPEPTTLLLLGSGLVGLGLFRKKLKK